MLPERLTHWARGAMAALVLTAAAAGTALAEAPQQKTQVPGWYRTMVGDFEVTALYDGYIDLDPAALLKFTRPGEIQRGMDRNFLTGKTIQTSVNGYLVNTGQQLILVDAGAQQMFGPTLGKLADNLKAAGYDPAQVDLVLITHLHADHVGGVLATDGQPLFPKAQIMLTQPEADFWLSDAKMQAAPKEMQGFFQMAKTAVAPYQAAGRVKFFAPNEQIAPGVKAVATGHTPGHSSYLFESKGQKMLVMGDMVHIGAVQFARPEVAMAFDTDNKPAIASRKAMWAQAAKEKWLLAGAHVSFPGLGHVRPEGRGYAWVPVEYSPIRGDK